VAPLPSGGENRRRDSKRGAPRVGAASRRDVRECRLHVTVRHHSPGHARRDGARACVSFTCERCHQRWELGSRRGLGLGHFEGRGWRGFRHHAALNIATCGFLVSERGRRFPPQDLVPPGRSKNLPFPPGYRKRPSDRTALTA
jgi:hypothetical protein